jgi:2-phosphosulfolactate phosphatase
MPRLDLYELPRLVPREALADATVIVIDLLRATTTICQALAVGAECVMPFVSIEETQAAAEKLGRGNVLLGGERHGKLIPGFDLGNSPAEYTPAAAAGRRILFTTTNGARALDHAREAQRVLAGAAINRTAVAEAVRTAPKVAILCAGTDGSVAREDVLAGGAIIEAMLRLDADYWQLNAAAADALVHWTDLAAKPPLGHELVAEWQANGGELADCLARELCHTDGGRNLLKIGHDADLAACAQVDTLAIVPVLDRATGELRVT